MNVLQVVINKVSPKITEPVGNNWREKANGTEIKIFWVLIKRGLEKFTELAGIKKARKNQTEKKYQYGRF